MTSATLTVDVGVLDVYLFVGVLNESRTISTPAPSAYLLKQGNFSSVQPFSLRRMRYGSGNLSVPLTPLQPNTNYSLYWMVTVDDSNLTCRHSKIESTNILTFSYLIYYLSSSILAVGASALLVAVVL